MNEEKAGYFRGKHVLRSADACIPFRVLHCFTSVVSHTWTSSNILPTISCGLNCLFALYKPFDLQDNFSIAQHFPQL